MPAMGAKSERVHAAFIWLMIDRGTRVTTATALGPARLKVRGKGTGGGCGRGVSFATGGHFIIGSLTGTGAGVTQIWINKQKESSERYMENDSVSIQVAVEKWMQGPV